MQKLFWKGKHPKQIAKNIKSGEKQVGLGVDRPL